MLYYIQETSLLIKPVQRDPQLCQHNKDRGGDGHQDNDDGQAEAEGDGPPFRGVHYLWLAWPQRPRV